MFLLSNISQFKFQSLNIFKLEEFEEPVIFSKSQKMLRKLPTDQLKDDVDNKIIPSADNIYDNVKII